VHLRAWVERERAHAERAGLIVAGGLAALLVWSRLAFLDGSFWHDESYTVVNYVNEGPVEILAGEYLPNNHALFNLLAWATTNRLGRFEAAYRVWSVLPAIAAVALVAVWAWRRFGRAAGLSVAGLMVFAPVHMDLAPQARGYGIGFLSAAAMLVAADRAARTAETRAFVWFGAAAVVGIWTLPPLALPAVGHGIVLAARPATRRKAIAAVVATGTASVAFYAPVLTSVLSRSQDDYESGPMTFPEMLTSWYYDVARPTVDAAVPDGVSRGGVLLALVALALVAALWHLARAGEQLLALNLAVPVAFTFVAYWVARFYYFDRFSSFLLVYVAVAIALGLASIWDGARAFALLRATLAVVAAVAIVAGTNSVVAQARRLPHENFQLVGELVRRSGIDEVVASTARPAGLEYYVGKRRFTRVQFRGAEQVVCTKAAPFVYVVHQAFAPRVVDTSCLERRGAAHIRVRQNTRGPVDVWIVTVTPRA